MLSTRSFGGGGASRFSLAGLMAAFALAGCAAAGGFVLAQDGNPESQARLVAARASLARVVYLGESHDNPAHHAHQARVLQALLDAGARPALAFEMLTQDQQREVDEAMRQADGAAALDARLRWRERGWPDFGMYQPLFELALSDRLPVIAADLDPGTVRRIAKEGLGVLPAAERAQLASRLRPDPEREARLEREIAEAHCGLLPAAAIPFMAQAWHARNVVMARQIGQALDEGRRVVVIVGRGHLERGGLPDQLNALRPGTPQLVVEFVEAPANDSMPRPGSSNIRWLTSGVDRGDPCAVMRKPR